MIQMDPTPVVSLNSALNLSIQNTKHQIYNSFNSMGDLQLKCWCTPFLIPCKGIDNCHSLSGIAAPKYVCDI